MNDSQQEKGEKINQVQAKKYVPSVSETSRKLDQNQTFDIYLRNQIHKGFSNNNKSSNYHQSEKRNEKLSLNLSKSPNFQAEIDTVIKENLDLVMKVKFLETLLESSQQKIIQQHNQYLIGNEESVNLIDLIEKFCVSLQNCQIISHNISHIQEINQKLSQAAKQINSNHQDKSMQIILKIINHLNKLQFMDGFPESQQFSLENNSQQRRITMIKLEQIKNNLTQVNNKTQQNQNNMNYLLNERNTGKNEKRMTLLFPEAQMIPQNQIILSNAPVQFDFSNFQQQQEELLNQVDLITMQNYQLEQLCTNQNKEIEKLQNQVELLKIQREVQLNNGLINNQNNEIIASLNEKISFVNQKNECLKKQIKTLLQQRPEFWDLVITSQENSLSSLVNNKWVLKFFNLNKQYQEHNFILSVYTFESDLLQMLNLQNKEKSTSIFTICQKNSVYLKWINSKEIGAKEDLNNYTQILIGKLLQKQHFMPYNSLDEKFNDQLAFTEFWLLFCAICNGSLILLCKDITQAELQLISYITTLQGIGLDIRIYIIQVNSHSNKMNLQLQILQNLFKIKIILAEQLDQSLGKCFIQIDDHDFPKIYKKIMSINAKKFKLKTSFISQLQQFILDQQSYFFKIKKPENNNCYFQVKQQKEELFLRFVIDQSKKSKLNLFRQFCFEPLQLVQIEKSELNMQLFLNVRLIIHNAKIRKIKSQIINDRIFIILKYNYQKQKGKFLIIHNCENKLRKQILKVDWDENQGQLIAQ